MNNAIVYDVMPCGSCKNRCFSEISAVTKAARSNIQDNSILYTDITLNFSGCRSRVISCRKLKAELKGYDRGTFSENSLRFF
jgi:hypothetical protein